MLYMFLESLAEYEYIIYIDIDKNSEFFLEQVIHSTLKGSRYIAVFLLHDSSSIGAKWCDECSVLFMVRKNANVVVPITKVDLRAELCISNCIHNACLVRDVWRIQVSILISSYKVMKEPCFMRLVDFRDHKHGGCRGVC